MLDNVGLRYPHRASGAKAPRTLRPLPLLRFAVSATGGAHLCSIQYYLRFWLSSCRTSLAVSALRIMRYCHRNRKRHVLTSLRDGAHAFSFLVPCAGFHLQPGKVPAGSGDPTLPLYFPVNRPMSPSRAQHFRQKFPISHPATGQFSTLTTFFADNFSCLRSVFHYLCKIITRYFVIYSCAILQL